MFVLTQLTLPLASTAGIAGGADKKTSENVLFAFGNGEKSRREKEERRGRSCLVLRVTVGRTGAVERVTVGRTGAIKRVTPPCRKFSDKEMRQLLERESVRVT